MGNNGGGPYANTGPTDWGVNNDGAGNLSGYAWSETVGWINFNPSHSQVTFDTSSGDFNGFAWSENTGWIHFKNISPAYKVVTTYTGTPGLWIGDYNSNWDEGRNWYRGSPPSDTVDVDIPAGDPQPTVNTVAAQCKNLNIRDGALLSISSGNHLTINGTYTANGTGKIDAGGGGKATIKGDIYQGSELRIKVHSAVDITSSLELFE